MLAEVFDSLRSKNEQITPWVRDVYLKKRGKLSLVKIEMKL